MSEIDTKRIELEVLESELTNAQAVLDEIPEINLEGQNVKHRMFGNGVVTNQKGTYIEVEFSSRTSKFILTSSFVDGFLSSEDTTVLERCRKLEAAKGLSDKLEKAIKLKQTEIGKLMEKIK